MIGLAGGDLDFCLAKTQCLYVQGVHKGIDHPYRVIFISVVIQGVR